MNTEGMSGMPRFLDFLEGVRRIELMTRGE